MRQGVHEAAIVSAMKQLTLTMIEGQVSINEIAKFQKEFLVTNGIRVPDSFYVYDDSFNLFFSECIKLTDNTEEKIKKNDLFQKYLKYCADNQYASFVGKKEFYQRVVQKGVQETILNGYKIYRNLAYLGD